MTTESPRGAGRGMLLVQLHGARRGQPWAPDAARGMLRRASASAGLGLAKPHQFRHSFATAVLDPSGGNLLVTREAGGRPSPAPLDPASPHPHPHAPLFD